MIEIENKVLEFFKNNLGIKNIDLSSNIADPNYSLFDIDAEYIMEKFFKEFSIDYSEFVIDEYFQYPDYSLKLLLKNILRQKINYPLKTPLTIDHLVKVAEKGEWFKPEE
ncbi:Protein of unknown function (DUF1493) [Apibacter mensalis]|jgi:hypothetical protein|uniref:Acyl carrier protein n=1 Tax=Apibacter mensalis TaxID=1586267 RepID=A0A0X3AQQ7_9FLAO|nr:DUF1493 family protein [Apibacter mensalis]CVK16198.1 Protein of unknown function (DUF1493) [Apibacter mensalis]